MPSARRLTIRRTAKKGFSCSSAITAAAVRSKEANPDANVTSGRDMRQACIKPQRGAPERAPELGLEEYFDRDHGAIEKAPDWALRPRLCTMGNQVRGAAPRRGATT